MFYCEEIVKPGTFYYGNYVLFDGAIRENGKTVNTCDVKEGLVSFSYDVNEDNDSTLVLYYENFVERIIQEGCIEYLSKYDRSKFCTFCGNRVSTSVGKQYIAVYNHAFYIDFDNVFHGSEKGQSTTISDYLIIKDELCISINGVIYRSLFAVYDTISGLMFTGYIHTIYDKVIKLDITKIILTRIDYCEFQTPNGNYYITRNSKKLIKLRDGYSIIPTRLTNTKSARNI